MFLPYVPSENVNLWDHRLHLEIIIDDVHRGVESQLVEGRDHLKEPHHCRGVVRWSGLVRWSGIWQPGVLALHESGFVFLLPSPLTGTLPNMAWRCLLHSNGYFYFSTC